MSRKIASILLALTVLTSVSAIAWADEAEARQDAYDQAAAQLAETGLISSSASVTDGGALTLASELGMLRQRSQLSLAELSAQALVLQQQQIQAEEEARQAQEEKQAFLSLYDGVVVTAESTAIRSSASSDAGVLRTLHTGKAAQLLDIVDDNWYRVSFGDYTGYISAADCQGVQYDDYAGTNAAKDLYAELIDYAYTYLGTPYVYGGSSYSGTDCSGFTMRVFGYLGYSLSHGARDQYRATTPVTTAQRQAGDLVYFSWSGGPIDHVGIYLGGGRFIHASTSQGVVVDSLYESYYANGYCGATRVIFD